MVRAQRPIELYYLVTRAQRTTSNGNGSTATTLLHIDILIGIAQVACLATLLRVAMVAPHVGRTQRSVSGANLRGVACITLTSARLAERQKTVGWAIVRCAAAELSFVASAGRTAALCALGALDVGRTLVTTTSAEFRCITATRCLPAQRRRWCELRDALARNAPCCGSADRRMAMRIQKTLWRFVQHGRKPTWLAGSALAEGSLGGKRAAAGRQRHVLRADAAAPARGAAAAASVIAGEVALELVALNLKPDARCIQPQCEGGDDWLVAPPSCDLAAVACRDTAAVLHAARPVQC